VNFHPKYGSGANFIAYSDKVMQERWHHVWHLSDPLGSLKAHAQ